MKISLQWLKNYIALDFSVNEIADALTTIGLEVEGIEEVETIKGGLKGIVTGKVLTCTKHPNADKLKVTTVDIGEKEPLHIVCGAPNVDAGQKVLVATVGTTLYNTEDPWIIKKGKIRGEVSEGMICAEDEIGLGSNHDGIMVLPDEAKIGTPAAEFFNVETDIVFEIGLTPNRSDATSHLGVARDLYAYLNINRQFDGDLKEPDVSSFDIKYHSKNISIEVANTKACPRYSGIYIQNIKVGESPDWLKRNLTAIGVRPLNNVVDITNFVLHELGQPLHAFDADKIAGDKIIVDTLDEGTTFLSLDEQKRTLHKDDLMICDGNRKGMCIAGVFGGAESGVSDSTTSIFLESAHFDAGFIRRTSTRHNLRTDAAKIYEKGSDPNITILALKRAVTLMSQIMGAEPASEITDIYPEKINPVTIHLNYQKVNRLIGADLSKDEIHDILRSMDMEIQPVNEDKIKVKVPTNKSDVTRDVDLIEEILRIYGFNRIDVNNKVTSSLNFTNYPSERVVRETIAQHLAAQGFNEMMGMSLIPSKYYDGLSIIDSKNFVVINNTSNIHLDIMRPEMMLSGLLSVLHNHNRQQSDLRLFEFGKSYLKNGESFEEKAFMTLFISGKRQLESWKVSDNQSLDFFDLKGMVHGVLNRLGINGFQTKTISDERLSYGLTYTRGPQTLVDFGQVSCEVADQIGVKIDTFYAEFDMTNIMNSLPKRISTEEISRYPSSRRDLALVVDQSISFSDILTIAKRTEKKWLKEVNLFDVYQNDEQLGKGKKSYAVSFQFENKERTLKDKEIDKVMNKLIGQYEHQLSATIRK